MAMSSLSTTTITTTTVVLVQPKHGITALGLKNYTTTSSTNYVRLARKKQLRFQIRSSSSEDASSSSSTTTTSTVTEEEEGWRGDDESSPAQVPKGPPSLISALNVQKALRGIDGPHEIYLKSAAITDVDHYDRLGLRMGCTFDQVRDAYQNKVEELSNQGLDEEELNRKLELLKESYTILSSEEERRIYDWSLARNERPDRYVWPFEVDITQIPKGTPPPQEPEDVGPTRVVGYFILGWLVLAFTLSIAFNR